MILASTSTLFSFSVAIPKICGSGSCRTSLLPGDPVSPVWRQSVVSWQLCHNSITSHSIHSFISLPDVIGPFFVCSTVTVNGNFNSLLPMLAETRTNKTVKSRANLLLSLADQPLLGDASLNVGHLWYFRETPSLHLLLVLQQMQGLSSVGQSSLDWSSADPSRGTRLPSKYNRSHEEYYTTFPWYCQFKHSDGAPTVCHKYVRPIGEEILLWHQGHFHQMQMCSHVWIFGGSFTHSSGSSPKNCVWKCL